MWQFTSHTLHAFTKNKNIKCGYDLQINIIIAVEYFLLIYIETEVMFQDSQSCSFHMLKPQVGNSALFLINPTR